MDAEIMEFTAIICSECDDPLDVLSGYVEPLYTDKVCECGSIDFYVLHFDVHISVRDSSDGEIPPTIIKYVFHP